MHAANRGGSGKGDRSTEDRAEAYGRRRAAEPAPIRRRAPTSRRSTTGRRRRSTSRSRRKARRSRSIRRRREGQARAGRGAAAGPARAARPKVKISRSPTRRSTPTRRAEHGPDILLLTNNPDAAAPSTWAGINWGTGGGTNLLRRRSGDRRAAAQGPHAADKAAADAIYRRSAPDHRLDTRAVPRRRSRTRSSTPRARRLAMSRSTRGWSTSPRSAGVVTRARSGPLASDGRRWSRRSRPRRSPAT